MELADVTRDLLDAVPSRVDGDEERLDDRAVFFVCAARFNKWKVGREVAL